MDMVMGMMEMMGMGNLFKHPLRVGDARSLLPALPPEGKKKLKRCSFFWILYSATIVYIAPYTTQWTIVYVWLPTCEIFNPRKKPPPPPAPMNIRRKKLNKERIAQKHASILAANAIPSIVVENHSNSLNATYLIHLV